MKDFFCMMLIMTAMAFSVYGCKSNAENKSANLELAEIDSAEPKTTIRFVATEHDFGTVKEGEKVSFTYEVVNTGKADLLIHNVRVSCGCTSPKYDQKPIRPNKKGSIKVTFNTKGRPGKQQKSVTVVTNTEPSNTTLSFTCEVIPIEK